MYVYSKRNWKPLIAIFVETEKKRVVLLSSLVEELFTGGCS
jgi:hypothetical protein